MAYELGIEGGPFVFASTPVTIANRVTNIYRRESGAWKIVHHHTDITRAAIDVLHRLKTNARAAAAYSSSSSSPSTFPDSRLT